MKTPKYLCPTSNVQNQFQMAVTIQTEGITLMTSGQRCLIQQFYL